MRSRRVSLRIPWPLDEAMKQVCKEKGFENAHACWIGAALVFVQNFRREAWVPIIANAKPKTQDYLLSKMLTFPTEMKGIIQTLNRLDNEAPLPKAHDVTLHKAHKAHKSRAGKKA